MPSRSEFSVSTNEDHGRCEELRSKIKVITDGEYSVSKREVDKLRQELGEEPLPSLQTMLDEKSAALSVLSQLTTYAYCCRILDI